MSWWAIVALAAGTFVLKAAGPVLLGGRPLPPLLDRAVVLLPAALLAALVAVQPVTNGDRLALDARAAGIAVAGVAAWRQVGFLTIVVLAVTTTAVVRALSG